LEKQPRAGEIVLSHDGRRIVTRSRDRAICVWDAASGRELLRFEGHEGVFRNRTMALSPDGRWIATGGADCTVRLWNAKTGAAAKVLKGHAGEIGVVLFSPDSRRLFTGSYDRKVVLWSVPDGQQEQVFEECANRVGHFDVDFKSERLVTVAYLPETNIGAVRSLRPLHDVVELRGHTASVNALAFSPDSRLVATGAGYWMAPAETRAIVWDTATGRQLTVFEGHREPVNGVAFLAGGERLLTSSVDGTAALWDVRSGKRLRTYGATFTIRGMAVGADEKTFVTAGWDGGRVRVWEAVTVRSIGWPLIVQAAIWPSVRARPQL